MTLKVKFTPQAQSDLLAIRAYTVISAQAEIHATSGNLEAGWRGCPPARA